MTGGAIVDGRPAHQGALSRLRRRGQRLMVSRAERDEAVVERRLLAQPGVTRANTVAVMSPTGGVGKTTCAFLVANLLVTHLKLRAIAVDANPEFGTLGRLVPEDRRPERDLVDLLRAADRLHTAADLSPYVARVATGLHVLAGRHDQPRAEDLAPAGYGELVALLSCFYEVVLLDLGPGVVGPLPALAARRADQVVLVMTPGYVTSAAALDALAHLRRHERTTVTINKSQRAGVELRVLAELAHDVVTLPRDDRLAAMLETGTYALGALDSPTRTAIKTLGLAVAEQLV
jgi:MinD-like ATPase involved in chromosome partitioning or flagellar assembly